MTSHRETQATSRFSPFDINIPESTLEDLRDRLRSTRWPEPATTPGWIQGFPRDELIALCHHWLNGYDWRSAESRLNGLPHLKTDVDGLGLHLVHVRSPRPNAQPLILTHGWPSSFLEFESIIKPLTEPTSPDHSAFHVVIPSLPGFAFSDRPTTPGWGAERIASAWFQIMARLGYERFGAVGGDWGAMITTAMSRQDPDRLTGILLMAPPVGPGPDDELTTSREQQAAAVSQEFFASGSGYAAIMSTRPQTIGYALNDSPAGLCAWLVEKLREWSDRGGPDGSGLSVQFLLDTVTLYWVTATATSASRIYWESYPTAEDMSGEPPPPVAVPTAGLVCPADTMRPTREWTSRVYPDLRRWKELDHGGHFPAVEQPRSVVDEIRAFFGGLL